MENLLMYKCHDIYFHEKTDILIKKIPPLKIKFSIKNNTFETVYIKSTTCFKTLYVTLLNHINDTYITCSKPVYKSDIV